MDQSGGQAGAVRGAARGSEDQLTRLLFARLALSLLTFVLALALDRLGWELSATARRGLFWTLSFAFFTTAISGLALHRSGSRQRLVAGFQIAVDVAIVTSLVAFSGGRESVLSFLYAIVTLYGAVLIGRRGATIAVTLSALFYGSVLMLSRGTAPMAVLLVTWAVQITALSMVGALASVLAGQVRDTGAALVRSTDDLRRLHDIHRRTVESLMSGLLTTDSDGRISSLNPEGERITGAREAEVIGHDVEALIPRAREIVAQPQADGSLEPLQRARLPYTNRNGEELHLGLAGSILRDAESRPAGHVVIFQDVSMVVAMEEELRLRERLAVAGEMAANMAHEIRNPLAAISGSVQILRRDVPESEPEQAKLMEIVVREADRLSGLISDFLDYAKPRKVQLEQVDIGDAIEDVQKMLEAIRPQNVRLRCEVEPALVAWLDRGQLSQLLWNLCVNALQAMPHGGTLSICASAYRARAAQEPRASSRRVAVAATALEICVRDTGVGMAAEVRERLFEPFFTTKQSGTGLGLATVHRIVESHAGELLVESEPGEGAVFRVRFPGSSEPEESA